MTDIDQLIHSLGEACDALGREGRPDEIAARIAELSADLFDAQDTFVYLRDPGGRLVLEASHPTTADAGPDPMPELVGWVAEQRGPSLIDPEDDAEDSGAEMAAPLRTGERLLGALRIRGADRSFASDHLELLRIFATHGALALHSARLAAEATNQLRQLDDRARRLDLLGRVARSLTRRLELDDLLAELLRLCAEAFDLRHCAVLLLDRTGGRNLVRRAAIGYDEQAPLTLSVGEGVTGHVASTGVPVFVPDVTVDPRYVTGVVGGRAEMAVPLKVFGQVIGVLDAESAELGEFDEQDLDLFASFAAQAAIAIRSADPSGHPAAGGSN